MEEELESPPEHITISPEEISASRPPLDDRNIDFVTVKCHMPARYTRLLAQLNVGGQVGAVLGNFCEMGVTNRNV